MSAPPKGHPICPFGEGNNAFAFTHNSLTDKKMRHTVKD